MNDLKKEKEELSVLGTYERALADKRYHKSNREHWGVSVPECEKFARKLSKDLSQNELLSLAQALWETNVFDPMVVAAKVLSQPKIKPTEDVWSTIITFLKSVDGWALEDHLAHIAWKCILANKSLLEDVEKWTKHPNFWMRRAALVYTLPFAKKGHDPERMLVWAAMYANDSEWFIQKAIGWWLRVLGEHNPKRVVQFLNIHWNDLKGVARREATRKLTIDWQGAIIQFKKS